VPAPRHSAERASEVSRRVALSLLFLLLAGLASLLFAAPGRGTWIVDPDAAGYVGLARSLAGGDGYAFAGEPHAKFPPGFPALLAVAIRLTDDPACYAAMRDLVTGAGIIVVLLTYFVGVRLLRLGRVQALALTALTGTSIYLAGYSVSFLRSEPLFTCLFLGALLSGEAWRTKGGIGKALLAAVLAGAATSVRTAGITAIAAIAIAYFLGRRARQPAVSSPRTHAVEITLFLMVALAPSVAFSVRNAGIQGAPGYGDELFSAYALDITKDIDESMPVIDANGMLHRVIDNTAVFALSLGKLVANHNKGANLATSAVDARNVPLHAGGIALIVLFLLGYAIAVRRGLTLTIVLLPLYVGLYLIWPFNQQERFYLPVAPFLLALLGFSAPVLLRPAEAALANRVGRLAFAAVSTAIVVFLGLRRSVDARVLDRWSTEYAALLAAAAVACLGFVALAVGCGSRRLDLARFHRQFVAGGLSLMVASAAVQFAMFHGKLARDQREFAASRTSSAVDSRLEHIKGLPELFQLLTILERESQPGDVVMSDIPKIIHVLTGMNTTPMRISSEQSTVILDSPQGRPRFLYYSREIPWVNAAFDAFVASADLEVLYEVPVSSGPEGMRVILYRVPR